MSVLTAPWSNYAVTQGYGPVAPGNPFNEPGQFGYPQGFHDGIDFLVPSGTSVPAPFAGVVVQAGDSGDGYGVKVALRAASGNVAFYGHLQTATVAVGQSVRAAQQLGYSNNTGNSTGPHLHVGAHTAAGSTLNPADFPDPGAALSTVPANVQGAAMGILGALAAHPRAVAWGLVGALVFWLW